MKVIVLFLFLTLGFLVFGFSSSYGVEYDLDLIELEITDLQIIPMADKPYYPYDNSDLVKIQFNITNTGLEYFVLSDKNFKIRVFDNNLVEGFELDQKYIVDNYHTIYDDELETRYDDYFSFEIFADCEYLHDRLFVEKTETFWICFDILHRWNNEALDLDGKKQHYLTLMDNMKSSSCPNCKDFLLTYELGQDHRLLGPNFDLPKIPTPQKQLELGITKERVQCREGLHLVFKFTDNKPACVSIDSIPKLVTRGWAKAP